MFGVICGVVVSAVGLAAGYVAPRAATVVLVIRHAEKAPEPPDDPPLSEAGRERARALAHVAAKAGVQTIFATKFLRTRQTVEPLASILNIEPKVDMADARDLAARLLKNHRGEVVLIAGHSNTVPQIVEALGGAKIDPIPDHEYDNLYVVIIAESGPPSTVRLRYGDPSPRG